MTLEKVMRKSLKDDHLHCAVAFKMAEEQGVPPGKVGDLATELDILFQISRIAPVDRHRHDGLGAFG